MIKVLTIVNKLDVGGIEKTLLTSLPLFRKNEVNIHVLCSEGGELEKQFIELGAVIHHYKYRRNPLYDSIFLFKLLKIGKFDIVHSRDGFTSGFTAIASRLASTPIIVSIHNSMPTFKMGWQKSLFLTQIRKLYLELNKKLILRLSSKIIGHSKSNLLYYTSSNSLSEKYELIYNGVDFSKFKNENLNAPISKKLSKDLKNSSKVFIHIGSFRVQKNHSFLIELFSMLEPRENNYKLILLGLGTLQKDIIEKVNKLNLNGCVYFIGLDMNIGKYLDLSDVFIFPSIHEGFGNVLIEAQYKKLAIAASSIPPHYESVYSSYHNYLFDPYELKDALDKVKLLLTDIDTGRFEKIKEDAYSFSENFSIDNMVLNLIKCYENVLNKNVQ